MSKLTQLERRMLGYDGVPAPDVARLERIPVDRVIRMRTALRARGLMPARPGSAAEASAPSARGQQTFEDLDREMRANRARGL